MGQERYRLILFGKACLMIVLILCFFMGHIWVRTRTVTLGYELGERRKKLLSLEDLSFNLDLKQQSEQDWERLDGLNLHRGWGLRKPVSEQLHFVSEGQL
jgi:hypothetical protein